MTLLSGASAAKHAALLGVANPLDNLTVTRTGLGGQRGFTSTARAFSVPP